MALEDELFAAIKSMEGREVFCIYCGASTGSVLDIHFAPTKPRSRVLTNTHFTLRQRENMGQVSMFVECSWRIEEGGEIAAASGDSGGTDAPFLIVRRLEGLTVEHAILAEPGQALDFSLHFQGNRRLSVFCDSGDADSENYTVFYKERAISVVSGYQLRDGS